MKFKVLIKTSETVEAVSLVPAPTFSYQIEGPRLNLDAFFQAYLGNKEVIFPPFNWDLVSPFTRKVLKALKTIGFGQSCTYHELASQIDLPKGARAVGQALGRNPFPLLLPCHRVLAKQGIGGFSAGLEIKQQLLIYEKILTSRKY